MDLDILQNVTPIKMEDGKGHEASFSSIESNCSYFNVGKWERGGNVPDASNIFVTPPPCNVPPQGDMVSTPAKSSDARKSLFGEDLTNSDEKRGADDSIVMSPEENLATSTMQKDSENFGDMWSNSFNFNTGEAPQTVYTFSDTLPGFQNELRVDVFSEMQEFTQNDVSTQVTQQETHPTQSSGYPCTSYQSNNGMIRSFSNEMNQQMAPHQTNNMALNNHQMGLQHMGYQATSPNAGDGSNSTHNSPFTASPQGFDYPTTPPMKPSIPPNTDYPGDFNFSINFGEATESAPKSAQYTYSHSLNKLFVKMNVTCPIKFKCNSSAPVGCMIRAVPVFKRPEHVTDVVTRCPNHKIPDEANFINTCSHLIRADMPDELVRYHVANDLRESVSVRYERPQVGAEYTTILYKFMCLSSCVGGINRRPLLTVFNLENAEGQVLGRRVVEVRICSCPGRDRAQEEKRKLSDGSAATSNGHDKSIKRPYKNVQTSMEINQTVNGKKRRVLASNGDQEEFILKVRGRDKFMMLKRVKEALDLMEYVTPQQQEAYRTREEQDQAIFRQQLATDAASRNVPQPQDNKESASSSIPSTISSVFTVSNPLTNAAVEGLMCPSHSSHPLTATPTGVSSSAGEEYAPSTSFADPAVNPHHYWTVDGTHLGNDIPDTSDPLQSTPSTSTWTPTPDGMRSSSSVPCCSAGMTRELSGASTVSVSSGSSAELPPQSRYVTRVLLRQTLSLNRDMKSQSDWILNGDSKEDPDDDGFSWDNIKTEKDGHAGCHSNQ